MRDVLVVAGFVFVLVVMIVLIAYNQEPGPEVIRTADHFDVLCLDGVEYWYRQIGTSTVMSPKFNPNGVTATKCEVD